MMLRDPGDIFSVPDEVMADEAIRPSWVELVGGKVEALADAKPVADQGAVDLSAMTVKDLRAYAKAHGIGLAAGVNTKAEIIAAIEAGPSDDAEPAAPFSDAPAPVHVSNEINDALGSTQPDWVLQGGGDI